MAALKSLQNEKCGKEFDRSGQADLMTKTITLGAER
jgi:hypothetical protein